MRSDDYTGRVILVYWLPAIVWAAVLLSASGDAFSSAHSADWIDEIIIRFVGHPLPPRQFDLLHFLLRKTAHLTAYFIAGALFFRAVRAGAAGWRRRWAVAAVALAAVVAILDEWHQFFVPSRGGTPWDVMIDLVGAAAAQLVAWSRGRGVSGRN